MLLCTGTHIIVLGCKMIKNHLEDRKYKILVDDILKNEDFISLNNITHHECNRFDHSVRVSYWSYKIGKFLRLDYEKIARASLLHDFFFEDNANADYKTRAVTMIKHPEYALKNAKKYYELTDLEEDIILSHMFPIIPRLPKYIESWIVDIVDDVVSIYEKTYVVRKQLSAASSFMLLFLINYIR